MRWLNELCSFQAILDLLILANLRIIADTVTHKATAEASIVIHEATTLSIPIVRAARRLLATMFRADSISERIAVATR